MRLGTAILLAGTVAIAACGGNAASSMSTAPSSTASATMTGAWLGTASDSSGSMMGAGLTSAMMNNAHWSITQTGNTFSGTMQFSGYMGGTMTVNGTMNGHSGTFTMTIPSGSMMMAGCTATASGTFDMDDMMTQFQGTYAGMNNCSGAFDHGQMSMHR
jgi:hypothetical protein